MCLGIPMRIRTTDGTWAVVERADGERGEARLLLVGAQPVGAPLLVHLQTAVRVLDEAEVPLIEQALQAIEAAGRGDAFEHLLGDLVNRTPQLPEHLRPPGDKR